MKYFLILSAVALLTSGCATNGNLSICTVGIWLLVWLLFINAKDPQCSICGRSNDFLGNILHKQKKTLKRI